MMNQRNYGATDTTPFVNVPLNDGDEQIEMDTFNGGCLSFDFESRDQSQRFSLTRNQRIALFGLALLILGGTVAALLYHFLSGNESSAPVTPSPFSPTTGSTGTTFNPTTWFSSTTGHTTASTTLETTTAMPTTFETTTTADLTTTAMTTTDLTTTAATTSVATTSALPTTSTPFMTTTTGSTTTGTTADPRCAFEPECCDAGQWICQ